MSNSIGHTVIQENIKNDKSLGSAWIIPYLAKQKHAKNNLSLRSASNTREYTASNDSC